jgi:hypothetical protein
MPWPALYQYSFTTSPPALRRLLRYSGHQSAKWNYPLRIISRHIPEAGAVCGSTARTGAAGNCRPSASSCILICLDKQI